MSQSYDQRRTIVENALTTEGVLPAKGKTVGDLAVKVLDALDHIKENVR